MQQPHDELEGHAAADQALLLADDLYVDVARRMKVTHVTRAPALPATPPCDLPLCAPSVCLCVCVCLFAR